MIFWASGFWTFGGSLRGASLGDAEHAGWRRDRRWLLRAEVKALAAKRKG